MKAKLFSLLSVIMLSIGITYAEKVQIGDLYYNLNDSNFTAEVAQSDNYYEGLSEVIIPATVAYNNMEYSVTSIGNSAFDECSSLKSIEIPNSVTSIGIYAFSYCTGLLSVDISSSVTRIGRYAFKKCRGLIAIICRATNSPALENEVFNLVYQPFMLYVPEGSIEAYQSASGWGDLASIQAIPPSGEVVVETITACGGEYVWHDMIFTESGDYTVETDSAIVILHLTLIQPEYVTDSMTIYDNDSLVWQGRVLYGTGIYYDTVRTEVEGCDSIIYELVLTVLPNDPTIIASGTCGDSLTWVLTTDSVLTISGSGEMGHYETYNYPWQNYQPYIKNLILHEGITTIGNSAFYLCENLISVNIPNSVRRVEGTAFCACASLKSVTIGNGVDYIDESQVFFDCPSLTAITVAQDNISYCDVDGVLFTKDKSVLIQYPAGKRDATYTIPNTVQRIAFCGISNISWLTYVDIPNSVITIDARALADNPLDSLIIPISVTSIGNQAFRNCNSLTFIASEAVTPPSLGDEVFLGDDTSIPLYVPYGAIEAYQAADGWNEFLNIQVKPIEETITACGDEYVWHEMILTESGDYTIQTDSVIVVLHLILIQPEYVTDSATINYGETFNWRGRVYSESGIYTDTLRSMESGCDSVIYELVLTVLPEAVIYEEAITACGGEYVWHEMVFTESGDYTIETDSTMVVLHLTLIQPEYVTDSVTIYDNDSLVWKGRVLYGTGIYYDTIRTEVEECDSVIFGLVLTVLPETPPSEVVEEIITACGGEYVWHEMVLNESGDYTIQTDSAIVVLHLTLIQPEYVTDSATINYGETFNWRGRVYAESGIYTDTLRSMETGCDSVICELVLTVLPEALIYEEAITACGGEYVWHEMVFTESGDYAIQTDSIQAILHLTLIQPEYVTDSMTIYDNDSLVWKGRVLRESGLYCDTIISKETGCDSLIICLELTVLPYVPPTVTIFGEEVVIIDPEDSTVIVAEVDILGDSTLIYTPADNTLTLSDVLMEAGDSVTAAISYTGSDPLTIVLCDSSTIVADTVISSASDIIITGTGTLVAEGVVPIVGAVQATITFDSVSMIVRSLSSPAAVRRRIRGGKLLDENGGPALSGFATADFNKTAVTPPEAEYGEVKTEESSMLEENTNALFVRNSDGTKTVLTEFVLTAIADPIDDAVVNISEEGNRAVSKCLIDGQLYILLPDGTRYTATGLKME